VDRPRGGSAAPHAFGAQDLAVAPAEAEALTSARARDAQPGRERVALDLEARVANHAVGLVERIAARREIPLDEERVRRPERERAQRAQVTLAARGDAELRPRV